MKLFFRLLVMVISKKYNLKIFFYFFWDGINYGRSFHILARAIIYDDNFFLTRRFPLHSPFLYDLFVRFFFNSLSRSISYPGTFILFPTIKCRCRRFRVLKRLLRRKKRIHDLFQVITYTFVHIRVCASVCLCGFMSCSNFRLLRSLLRYSWHYSRKLSPKSYKFYGI